MDRASGVLLASGALRTADGPGTAKAAVAREETTVRRGLGAETTEETTFDRFRVNPKIDPRRFEVRK